MRYFRSFESYATHAYVLQLRNIYYKAMKSDRILPAFPSKRSAIDSYAKTSFPFLSFPDSYFVGSSSSVRAKLEPHGVISNANVRGLFLWSICASTYVSPRGKSSWKLRLFLKNYSWYYRNTRIVDSQKTKEDFGLFQIKIMPRFCAVFSTASLKPYANLRLSFREPMTATLPYSSFP